MAPCFVQGISWQQTDSQSGRPSQDHLCGPHKQVQNQQEQRFPSCGLNLLQLDCYSQAMLRTKKFLHFCQLQLEGPEVRTQLNKPVFLKLHFIQVEKQYREHNTTESVLSIFHARGVPSAQRCRANMQSSEDDPPSSSTNNCPGKSMSVGTSLLWPHRHAEVQGRCSHRGQFPELPSLQLLLGHLDAVLALSKDMTCRFPCFAPHHNTMH